MGALAILGKSIEVGLDIPTVANFGKGMNVGGSC